MTMTTSSSARSTALRYRNSDAYSTSTGTLHSVSRMYSPTRPACHEVPQPQMMMRRAARSLSSIVYLAPSGPTSCSMPPSVSETPDLIGAGRSSGCARSPTWLPRTGDPGSFEMHTRPRMQLSSAVGCSIISLSIKCLYPPFSICSRLPSSATRRGLSAWPASVDTWCPSVRWTTAISPSLRCSTLRVYSRKAEASLATKYSSSPTPTMSGEPIRAAIRMSGSSCEQMQMP
mmetsp:Transcript_5928/g.19093  ORF Transcript_5928/g.19093 Transcript_5928/m.19093 type:complete len:231 (-) Transcript_5928:710-1402(-)